MGNGKKGGNQNGWVCRQKSRAIRRSEINEGVTIQIENQRCDRGIADAVLRLCFSNA